MCESDQGNTFLFMVTVLFVCGHNVKRNIHGVCVCVHNVKRNIHGVSVCVCVHERERAIH